jgi:hypothetical protein
MRKEKVGFFYRSLHIFTHHPWLKVASLLLAIVTWLFVKGEITRMR